MDFELCLARDQSGVARGWDARDLAAGWAYQQRLVDRDGLDAWFYGDAYNGTPPVIEPIPERWRSLV